MSHKLKITMFTFAVLLTACLFAIYKFYLTDYLQEREWRSKAQAVLGDPQQYVDMIKNGNPKGYSLLALSVEYEVISKNHPLYKDPLYYNCKGALAGNDGAQFKLSMLIGSGEIKVKDSAKQSNLWGLLAANQGNYLGPFYQLGVHYHFSAPVSEQSSESSPIMEEHYLKALYYYLLTDQNAGTPSERVKDPKTHEVISKLTEEQVSITRLAVSKWKPKTHRESIPYNVPIEQRPDLSFCEKSINENE